MAHGYAHGGEPSQNIVRCEVPSWRYWPFEAHRQRELRRRLRKAMERAERKSTGVAHLTPIGKTAENAEPRQRTVVAGAHLHPNGRQQDISRR
jgi:hypothetical protein